MDYPPTILPTLEALYRLAQRVCMEVESSQPDIVIGLAHSGWMPVVVAKTLWAETHTTAFPPTVRTNIGQEKHAIYRERFKPPMPAYCCGECCGGSIDRLGHFLAWIADQQPWLDTLQAQIQAVSQQETARILVVDDLFGGYRTCYIALGLLETLYPQAQVSMIAGDADLTNHFVTAWLMQFAPVLGNEIAQNEEHNRRARYANPWHERLNPLITGSEDITPESLEWRTLGAESPAVQAIAGQVDLKTILTAPAWAESLACQYAISRHRGDIHTTETDVKTYDRFMRQPPLKLGPIERLLGQAWLENGITRKDIAQAFDGLPDGFLGGLQKVMEYARPYGRGRGTVYYPEEAGESWISAYDQRDPLMPERSHLHITGFGEFIPGQLWAGAYPPFDRENQARMMKDLLSRGIQCFVDLTTPSEIRSRWLYAEAIQQAGNELGVSVTYIHYPLHFRAVPAHRQMSALLEKLQSMLDHGERVYLHAGHNLEGRTPMTLACLLINQARTPEQALFQVTNFWLRVLPYLIHLPLTPLQRQFILRWKRI
jgi:hypothetical protein